MAWLWSGLGWVLLVAGLGVVAWALFWDRAGWRGRAVLRCRKCWYDLTGVGAGAVERATAGDPVVCPECGREHRSRRAMRRTRRRWGCVVCGAMLLFGAYGASAWPRLSASTRSVGWPGAVPTPVLIVSMRWMPAEAGSLPDRSSSPVAAIPYRQRPWGERFGQQIMTRLYKPESTTRLDRWLFVRAARGEPPEVLTEPTAVRGEIYRYVFDAWEQQRRLSYEDDRWARSVHQLRAEHTEYALDRRPTYARVQVRRLVKRTPWRVRLGEQLFEPKRRAWPEGRNGFVDLRPVDLPVNGWWDGNVLIDRHLYRNSGVSFGGPAPTTFELTITGRVFEGDPAADVWWPVAEVAHPVEFKIASIAWVGPEVPPARSGGPGAGRRVESVGGFVVMNDTEARPVLDWLERSIEVRLQRDNRWWSGRGDGLPDEFVLFIDGQGSAPKELPAFTFGGNTSIVLRVRRGGGDPENPRIDTVTVFECDPAWWSVRDKRDDQGKRVFEHAWHRVPIRPTRWFQRHGGEIPVGLESLAQNDEVIGAWLEVQFGADIGGNEGFRPLADLEAERILTHTVRIPMGAWPFQNCKELRSDGVRLPTVGVTPPGTATSTQN